MHIEKGQRVAIAALAAGTAWLLFSPGARAAPAPAPTPDCTTDAECLDKRYAMPADSKVTPVIAAARLTSGADPKTTSTGSAWVAAERSFGFAVITDAKVLGEGTILLALEPERAAELVSGGLFRYV